MQKILSMILAGGEGKRLFPLTQERAKPAVPFGGKYRIIDFVINNFINSELYKIKILTQFKSDSLNRHITRSWPPSPIAGQYVDLVPAQMRLGQSWYQGTADAIYQNLNIIRDEQPDLVCVFGGDHVYKMDIRQMIRHHNEKEADLTIAAIPVPVAEACGFGIIEVDKDHRIIGWQEKPEKPKEMPNRPGWALASMGNYVFNKDALVEQLVADAFEDESKHDFGHNIVPGMLKSHRVFVYDFHANRVPGACETEHGYWRDVGDIDSYWQAHMDMLAVDPAFNLHNLEWPIHTKPSQNVPTKFMRNEGDRVGLATESIISDGCIISGGRLSGCVLSPKVNINSFCRIEESVLLTGVELGRHVKLRRVIVDKYVKIPEGTEIGVNPKADAMRGFTVSPGGVTVVPKGTVFSERVVEAPV